MTNLTKQEIEQEKEKFDEWFLNKFEFSTAYDLFENGRYLNTLIDVHWQPWLARAELEKAVSDD